MEWPDLFEIVEDSRPHDTFALTPPPWHRCSVIQYDIDPSDLSSLEAEEQSPTATVSPCASRYVKSLWPFCWYVFDPCLQMA